jgi:hypothetical protein
MGRRVHGLKKGARVEEGCTAVPGCLLKVRTPAGTFVQLNYKVYLCA